MLGTLSPVFSSRRQRQPRAARDLASPCQRALLLLRPGPARRISEVRTGRHPDSPAVGRLLAVPEGPSSAHGGSSRGYGVQGGAGGAIACRDWEGEGDAAAAGRTLMLRLLGRVMSFSPMPPPPPPPPPPARTQGGPAARQLSRRPCGPPAASPPAPAAAAAGEKKRRPPEMLLSSSWPSATLKRPPARRGPGLGPGTPQPPTSARVPPQPSPGRGGTSATCSAPRRIACSHIPAGSTASGTSAGAGAGPEDATRFSLSLTPEAILVIQRRHLEKQLLARPRRPFPAPSADPRRPLVPCPRTRSSTLRRGGPTSVPDAPLAVAVSSRPPRASLLPGGLQATMPSPRPSSLRPVLKVSLLNEKHKYDDEEYEEEVEVVDEGLVRKCTEWLRGVESAAAARGRTGHLDSLPHLSTL